MSWTALRWGSLLSLIGFLAVDLFYFNRTTVYTNHELQYWLQLLSGNWSRGDQPENMSQAGYSASVLLALVLGLGNFIAVFTLLYKLWGFLSLRERVMRLADITAARDLAIKLALIDILPDEQAPLIEAAFTKGDAAWHRNTVKIHGPEIEETIRAILQETKIPPKTYPRP